MLSVRKVQDYHLLTQSLVESLGALLTNCHKHYSGK